LAAVVVGGNISSTLLTLILVPVVYNFFDWGGGLATRGFRTLMGSEAPEVWIEDDTSEEQPEKDEKEKGKGKGKGEGRDKPAPTPRPSTQPGSAISLNPTQPRPDPDAL
jgi:hypothetical protein